MRSRRTVSSAADLQPPFRGRSPMYGTPSRAPSDEHLSATTDRGKAVAWENERSWRNPPSASQNPKTRVARQSPQPRVTIHSRRKPRGRPNSPDRLENRQWSSRSLVGSNPTPAARAGTRACHPAHTRPVVPRGARATRAISRWRPLGRQRPIRQRRRVPSHDGIAGSGSSTACTHVAAPMTTSRAPSTARRRGRD